MKRVQVFKAIRFFLLGLFTVFNADILADQQPMPKILFTGSDGKIIEGKMCGTESPDLEAQLRNDAEVKKWLKKGNFIAIETDRIIPIAFHVVRHDDGSGDVTDQQIEDQVAVLNEHFIGSNFSFVIYRIDRTNNTAWSTHVKGSLEEEEMKDALAIMPEHLLNFYICENPRDPQGQILGYATFPWKYPENSFMHGVVVRYSTLPGGAGFPYNEGDNGIHEVGHFMGLYHTFQNGCQPPGDHVDDTPYQADGTNTSSCNPTLDTCPADPGNDPIHNFMNYTDDACRNHFTSGQFDRIHQQMAYYRPTMYNHQVIEVLVDQKLSLANTSIGTIGRWNGNNFEPRFVPPDTLPFIINTTEVMHGDTNIYEGEKYNRWNDYPDVTNHHVFNIDPNFPNVLMSNFSPTKPGIVIRNEFVSAPGANPDNDIIDFKDPWLIDYPDPQYGDNKRNRGMAAPFKSRPSPFHPDYTTSYNGEVYQGLFLNQSGPPLWNPPYYSVRARQTQTIPFHGQDIT